MSARLELRLRGALARLGTPQVSGALLALACVYVAVAETWARTGSADGASALSGSLAYRVLAGLLVLDALVAVSRALRGLIDREGRVALRAASSRALLASAWLLAALAFAASQAGRDRLILRLAEGEEYVAAEEQLVGRDPPRPMAQGPLRTRFTLQAVRLDAGGVVEEVSLAMASGGSRRAGSLSPAWLGWGRLVRPLRAGRTVRYEIATEQGAIVESAFAKLEAGPSGAFGTIRVGALPYRVVVREAEGGTPRAPRLGAGVYRGKLLVAEGGTDAPLRFEGLVFRFPEWRPWVDLEVLRDPGIPLALIAAALAVAGLLAGRRRGPGRAGEQVSSGGRT